MQNLYDEIGSLDKRCYEEFNLSEDILMEHAADSIADFIKANFSVGSSVLIATGSGNNGADGITLARILHKDYDVRVFAVKKPKSPMAVLQEKRAKLAGVEFVDEIIDADIVVDAILGTGFNGEFDESLRGVMQKLNSLKGYKIACDIPSGINRFGVCEADTFRADTTITMGALKKALFLDEAKDFVGNITVSDLGVSRSVYERESNWKLLEFDDLKLPYRDKKNTNKGGFGHTAVIAGSKTGAAVLCGSSALRIGSGLVTIVGAVEKPVPYELMQNDLVPKNTTAIAVGMGLGNFYSNDDLNRFLDNDIPKVIDADLFYHEKILDLLKQKNIILTPHPKEFGSLLKVCGFGEFDVNEIQKRRFELVELFCQRYPNAVLLLKGANMIIGQKESFFVNPMAKNNLSKGGSGDVLAGITAGLLAQGYTALEAALNGSLILAKLSNDYKNANFSLTPKDLIEGLRFL